MNTKNFSALILALYEGLKTLLAAAAVFALLVAVYSLVVGVVA